MSSQGRTPIARREGQPGPAPRPEQGTTPGSSPEAPLVLRRATLDPAALRPRDVLRLQRSIGNRAVGRLLSGTARQAGLPTLQRTDWATSAIRQDIQTKLPGGSGHHIIAKEDLTTLRSWSVKDQNDKNLEKPAHARQFSSKYGDNKKLWNLGFNVVAGPSRYTNNPGSRWDPGTEQAVLAEEDEAHLGLTAEEVAGFGIEKRVMTGISRTLEPIQALIDERRAGGEGWDEDTWKSIFDTLAQLETDEETDEVNAYEEDEWTEDVAREDIKPSNPGGLSVGEQGRVKVDPVRVRIVQGKLRVDGREMAGDAPVTQEGDYLKVNGAFVKVAEDGVMKAGATPLQAWGNASYRKREGYVMSELSPDGADSIFVKTARTNRDEALPGADASYTFNVSLEAFAPSLADDAVTVSFSIKLGHVLRRHSFQRWEGDMTNINVFFPPAMKDSDIREWCQAQARSYFKTMVLPAFLAAREKGIEDGRDALDPKEKVPPDHQLYSVTTDFSYPKRIGVTNGIYLNAAVTPAAEMDDDYRDTNRKIEVHFETMSMQSEGIQVPQKLLREFKAAHPVLPLVLG